MSEKKKGSLLGLAYGDILGCPVETYKDHEIRAIYGDYSDLPKEYPLAKIPPQRKKRLRPLGLHSDDTQQAMALISLMLSRGSWDKRAWAGYLLQGMQKGAWRGFGKNFKLAVDEISKKTPLEKTGSESAGIGSAMRIGPLGALLADKQISTLQKIVAESTFITHGDIRSASIAYAVAYANRLLVLEENPTTIAKGLAGAVQEFEDFVLENYSDWNIQPDKKGEIPNGLDSFFKKDYESVAAMRKEISKIAAPLLMENFTKAHPNQGFALLGGLHALALSLLDNRQPKEILLDIIRQGYDTDTVAAIAGGLLGSRHGTDWIPVEEFLDKDRILTYAEAIVTRRPIENVNVFIQKEADLSNREKQYIRKEK